MMRKPLLRILLCTVAAFLTGASAAFADGAVSASWVSRSATGNLLYRADAQGVRILDYSGTGYKGGATALPDVARLVDESRWIRLNPQGSGQDDTAMINEALSRAGLLELVNGWRGVVYLGPGEYRLGGTLHITSSGVVLKGAGSSGDSATRLRATAREQYTLIEIAGAGQLSVVEGTERALVEKLVPAGTRTFRVERTAGLKPGDAVLVKRPTTDRWIHAMDMDRLVNPWFMNYDVTDLWFQRTITRIERGWITVDEPLPQTIEHCYGGASVSRYCWPGRIENVGVEDLYCVSDYHPTNPPDIDESHAWKCIEIISAQDVWVRNVVGEHFGFGTVNVLGARRVTVAESQNLHPISVITGDRRYSFSLDRGELVLVRDCYSNSGRHDYVLAALTPGPNAFVRSRAKNALDDTGPHHRWSVGALFDNVAVDGNELNIQNRGNSGGGHNAHGWTGGYMAVWNSSADDGFRVRNPPTARNWLIGGSGEIKASKHGCWCSPFCWWHSPCWSVGADPEGTYEHSGESHRDVTPYSLYFAQRQQRLKWPRSEFREYRLGDIDEFTVDSEIADRAPVNPNWLLAVRNSGPESVSSRFDGSPSASSRRAFTFNFALGTNDRVRAASLTLELRAGDPGAAHRLYLDSLTTSSDLDLGLGPILFWTSSHTVEVNPEILQDGRLNVALSPNISVDYAVLNLQISSAATYDIPPLTPEADAYVRAGDSAGQNFGGEAELVVKNEGSGSDFTRQAIAGWNLGGVREAQRALLADAKIRLYCNATGQPGNEQSAAVLASSDWSEGAVTWNNQPASRPPIAYWVPVEGQFVEFTVTQEVAASLAGDRRFSVRIEAARDWGDAGWVRYASKEDPDAKRRPELVLRFYQRPLRSPVARDCDKPLTGASAQRPGASPSHHF
jgi:hypothetical protein